VSEAQPPTWEPPPEPAPEPVPEPPQAAPAGHPIRIVVTDDRRRSRLTVLFRLILAIPHLVWFSLWTLFTYLIAVVAWLIALFLGRLPTGLHEFFELYVRYSTRLHAYLLLAANPYPPFGGTRGNYPVEIEVDEPVRQSRWKIAFRLVLAIPALMIATVLLGAPSGGGSQGQSGLQGSQWTFVAQVSGVAFAAAFLGWWVCLVRGRMPLGFRDLVVYALRYTAQTIGYLLFLTSRYPTADPFTGPSPEPPPAKPIRIVVDDDLRRSRLTVLFRFPLTVPHIVWLTLWSVAAFVAAILNWFATLVAGRSPSAFHRFLAAYVRYGLHVYAFLFLVGNPFPGFTGAAGRYPIDLEVDGRERQHRGKTLFRFLLAIPAFFVSGGLNGLLFLVGLLGWFASLVLGRMPYGLRNAGAYALRYSAQVNGYLLLLTDSYPYSGPAERVVFDEEPAPPVPPPSPPDEATGLAPA
jgi:hypothetical protein